MIKKIRNDLDHHILTVDREVKENLEILDGMKINRDISISNLSRFSKNDDNNNLTVQPSTRARSSRL